MSFGDIKKDHENRTEHLRALQPVSDRDGTCRCDNVEDAHSVFLRSERRGQSGCFETGSLKEQMCRQYLREQLCKEALSTSSSARNGLGKSSYWWVKEEIVDGWKRG